MTGATCARAYVQPAAGVEIVLMSAPKVARERDEPIGIVISSGKREEPMPAFTAYVWGPASDEPDDPARPARD